MPRISKQKFKPNYFHYSEHIDLCIKSYCIGVFNFHKEIFRLICGTSTVFIRSKKPTIIIKYYEEHLNVFRR